MLALLTLGTALGYVGLGSATGFWSIGLATAALAVVGTAIFPIMVWVQALEMTPLAYLLMSAAMQSIDPRLEEASAIAGAGTWPTFRRVTLPLIVPAAAAAALLLFIQTIESFEVPLLLGGRARVAVYTTQVYFNTSRMPTDWGLSSTYSIVLLFLSMSQGRIARFTLPSVR